MVKNWTRRQTGLGPTTPETKSTTATKMVTRIKRFVVFLFYKISEVDFLHAKWRFWVTNNKPHQVMRRQCGFTSTVILIHNIFYLSPLSRLLHAIYEHVLKVWYFVLTLFIFTSFRHRVQFRNMLHFFLYFHPNFDFALMKYYRLLDWFLKRSSVHFLSNFEVSFL
jgi:hypothetical protein